MKFKTAIASLIAVSLTGCAVPSQVTKVKPEVTSTSHIKDGTYNCFKTVWAETRWDPHAKGKLIPEAYDTPDGVDLGPTVIDLKNGVITYQNQIIPVKPASTSQLESVLAQNKVLRANGQKMYSAVQLEFIDLALYNVARGTNWYNSRIKEYENGLEYVKRNLDNNVDVHESTQDFRHITAIIKNLEKERADNIKNNGISKILSYDTTGKWHTLVAYYDSVSGGKKLTITASNSQTWNTIDFSCQVNTK